MLTNPVVISILVMTVLCLLRFNILLAILISALTAGLVSGASMIDTTNTLITGMKGNLETALSYILLGALASAIARTNLTAILIRAISNVMSKKATYLVLSIAAIACLSQNLIPVHIAFIPVLIPPLLPLFNKLKLDRRAVACALTFGLKAPYVSIGVGFGLIFHTILMRELGNNGVTVSVSDVASVMWIGGASMLAGLMLAIIFYSKKREYIGSDSEIVSDSLNASMSAKEWAVLAGAVVAFGVQIYTSSMPLGALCGLVTMIVFKGIEYNKVDEIMSSGLAMMAFIAFIMLVAAGFGAVLRESGGIDELVSFASAVSGGKLGGILLMLLIGLLITMGIGSSFGTIPVISSIYVPFSLALGLSTPAIILLIGVAAALGDAGSPASDSTLGPTSGLNADDNHSHIYDTCVPTFVFFNIPLMIGATIGAMIL
ncbi:Na+/H+ antiporter NhaC family protein [Campylobacter sp. 9BO]|uniref:Na+/H+ antiporter NhaC family protein n=1 Tax=Campylobacter sp. 9BO TaxID=3424759 RepID=UPI003D349F54